MEQELGACLRTGRALRTPRARARKQRTGSITDVTLGARPDVESRKTPGHWEGDLVRHEALCNRPEVKDLRRCIVTAA